MRQRWCGVRSASLAGDKICPAVALQEQKTGQIGMVQLQIDGRPQHILSGKGDTHPGGLQHRHVICAIANGRCIAGSKRMFPAIAGQYLRL